MSANSIEPDDAAEILVLERPLSQIPDLEGQE
jgi:hypothetical protein